MNRDDVLRLAVEAEILHAFDEQGLFTAPVPAADYLHRIERFAALVAAHEREECARVCDELDGAWDQDGGCIECATAIRARGSDEPT